MVKEPAAPEGLKIPVWPIIQGVLLAGIIGMFGNFFSQLGDWANRLEKISETITQNTIKIEYLQVNDVRTERQIAELEARLRLMEAENR